MPANKSRDTLARQWELLKTLPSHGSGKSARELTEHLAGVGFDVSKRQVERDLAELSSIFPLRCNDKSVPYGWRWEEYSSADLPGLTLAESLSLRLVEDTLRPLLPAPVIRSVEARFRQAARTLAGLAGSNAVADWPDKVRVVPPVLPLCPPEVPADLLEALQVALLHNHRIEADYRKRGAEQAATYRLDPLALVQSGPVSYLVAVVEGFEAARLFAVHRFQRVVETDTPVRRPKGFDLNAVIAAGLFQFGESTRIRLEARIGPALHDILAETALSEDQTLTPIEDGPHRGQYTLTATMVDSHQLRRWLLSQGAGIVVTAPTALRLEIRKRLRESLAGYDDPRLFRRLFRQHAAPDSAVIR